MGQKGQKNVKTAWTQKIPARMKQGTEIVEMLFKELTREEDLEISRLDGYEEGERAGAEQKQCEIAKSLRESGIPIDVIAKNTGLSEKEIAEL